MPCLMMWLRELSNSEKLRTWDITPYHHHLYGTLAQLVRASDSYPEGPLFDPETCYQFYLRLDDSLCKTLSKHTQEFGSNPCTVIRGRNSFLKIF